ncbi:hypothetical protein SAMN05216404_11217 [Nitrosospira multiformis]|uniref:Uncharacterized protein n=1 Tax=Nitrosospira multiformis TaxID=1231 RepID=A0A1H8M668_9PROT|nr:hypothetical protein SAMN05216404_11217 [Nitrosospira multiformis]
MALGIVGIPSEQYGVIDKAEPVPSTKQDIETLRRQRLSISCLQRVGRNDGLEQ